MPILASFLRKNQRALKLSTLTTLNVLVTNYGKKSFTWHTNTVLCCSFTSMFIFFHSSFAAMFGQFSKQLRTMRIIIAVCHTRKIGQGVAWLRGLGSKPNDLALRLSDK